MAKKEGSQVAPVKKKGAQLLTVEAQGALAQTFQKEKQMRASATAKNTADLRVLVDDPNFKTNIFEALRKSGAYLSDAAIGGSMYELRVDSQQIAKAGTRQEEARARSYRDSQIYQRLFGAEEQLQKHDTRDRFFSREKFLAQPPSGDAFVVPLRSSEVIGWLPALPRF